MEVAPVTGKLHCWLQHSMRLGSNAPAHHTKNVKFRALLYTSVPQHAFAEASKPLQWPGTCRHCSPHCPNPPSSILRRSMYPVLRIHQMEPSSSYCSSSRGCLPCPRLAQCHKAHDCTHNITTYTATRLVNRFPYLDLWRSN